MNRTEARVALMQMLYSMEIQNDFSPKAKTAFLTGKNVGNQKKYINDMFAIISQHKEDIDNAYTNLNTGWKLGRLSAVDLAIFRLAIGEILYMEDIPVSVSINEAVELAKTYSSEESAKFINGVLAKIAD
jgi:N utilization substance protein B